MARSLQVYPQGEITGGTWTYALEVSSASGVTEFTHFVPAGISAPVPLPLLKVVFGLSTPDGVTDQDVDDALFVDLISRGPNRNQTVWTTWRLRAESIIAGLGPSYTDRDFWTGWSFADTSRIRTDARDVMERVRGWTVLSVHQHEGDLQTNTDE